MDAGGSGEGGLAVPYDQGVSLIAGAVSTVDPSVGQFVEMMAEKKVTPRHLPKVHFLGNFGIHVNRCGLTILRA